MQMKRDSSAGQPGESELKDQRHAGSDVNRAADTVARDNSKHHLRRRVMEIGDDDVDDKEAAKRCAAGERSACRRRLQRRDVAKQQQQQLVQHHKVRSLCFVLFMAALCNRGAIIFLPCSFVLPSFMVALCNRETIYIFML